VILYCDSGNGTHANWAALFAVRRGLNAAAIFQGNNKKYGQECLKRRAIFKCCKQFKEG
jgi:hypothetical protein